MKRLWELSMRIVNFLGVTISAIVGSYELVKYIGNPTDHKLLVVTAWGVSLILFRGSCAEEEG